MLRLYMQDMFLLGMLKCGGKGSLFHVLQAARMRAPVSNIVQNPDGKLIIEIVAAFKLEACLIAASPPSSRLYTSPFRYSKIAFKCGQAPHAFPILSVYNTARGRHQSSNLPGRDL